VLRLFLVRSPRLHRLNMSTCHRLSKGWLRGAGGGSTAPRGRLPPDQAALPPPSCGGLWAGLGSLLGGNFAQLSQVDGRLHCFFARISVGMRLSVNFPCICVYVLQNNILQIHVELGQ